MYSASRQGTIVQCLPIIRHAIAESQVVVNIVSELSGQFDTQRQTLDSEGPLTKNRIEFVVAQRF